MEGHGREPSAIRQQSHDAAVRDDIRDRSGHDAEQALVVRCRFGERAQRPRQDVKPVVSTLVSVCGPHIAECTGIRGDGFVVDRWHV